MKREELISILEELAEKDLNNGSDIYDHPCSVAIRRIKELESALKWCSGSADFGEGGQARKGWLKVCEPLLEK